MRIQDYFVETTQRGVDELFRYAAAVPADKLDWAPEGGRSTLDICREVALTPEWALTTMRGDDFDFNEETFAKVKEMQSGWTTVEQCKAEYDKRAGALNEFYKNLPDEKLTTTRVLPFVNNKEFTMVEMAEYPSWNANYHTGQIAYIQTLLGDKDLH
jgi:hypothetical protein